LIGCLSLSGVGGVEAEGYGMVHPRFRRRGVFGALLAQAKAICVEQHTLALILICDSRSESGHRFLKSINASLLFAEHGMRLASWQPREVGDVSVVLQRAVLADAEQIAAILAEDAGMAMQSFLPMIRRSIADGSRHYYVAKVDSTTIGTVNIDVIDGLPYIYGFVVVPEQRGKGYGRQMLTRLLDLIAAEHSGPILLEVETENLVALSLYSSLGFEITQTFEYFRVDA
jgi:ribosomal protein S18 acetylase RimI-like enzyme